MMPHLPSDHRLAPIVTEAFDVFRAPAPQSHGVCRGCCLPPRLEAGFPAMAQWEISEEFLRAWYQARPERTLAPEDIGWFLPRIMELAAMDGDDVFPEPESVFDRLPLAGFPDAWEPRAVDVFRRFALSLFRQRVLAGSAPLDTTIAMFANSGLRAGPFLNVLWTLDTPVLTRILHAAWCVPEPGRIWQTPFWTWQADRVKTWDWYLSPEMVERMTEAAGGAVENAGTVLTLLENTIAGPNGTL